MRKLLLYVGGIVVACLIVALLVAVAIFAAFFAICRSMLA